MNRRNIYLMYLISFLQGMVFYAPIATLYRQAQGVSVFEISLIETVFMLLCLGLEIPWGIVADRIGCRRTVVLCSIGYFATKVIFWQATAFWGFLLERVLLAVVIAGLSGVDTTLVYLSCKGQDSQKVFGVLDSCGTAGLLLASAVYSLWIDQNYALAGFLTVVSYGAAAVLSLGLCEVGQMSSQEKDSPVPKESFRSTLVSVFSRRELLVFLVGVALLSESHQMITVFLNQLQYQRCGMDDRAIGFAYLLVSVVGLLGGWSAWVSRRGGIHRTGRWFYLSAAALCLLLTFTESAVLSVAAILLLKLVYTLFVPMQTQLQNQMIIVQNRATALSINAMLVDLFSGGANLLFGGAAQRDLRLALLLGALFCAAGCGCFEYWWHKSEQK